MGDSKGRPAQPGFTLAFCGPDDFKEPGVALFNLGTGSEETSFIRLEAVWVKECQT